MMRRVLVTIGVAMLGGVGGLAQSPAAEETTNRTEITANKLVFDYAKRTAVFDGDVVAKDATMRIESDRLIIQLDPQTQQLQAARAIGRVRITEQDRIATADEAEYTVADGRLVLTGQAMVMRGNERLSGAKITFWRTTNRVECERPVMILLPGKEGSKGWGP
jgi:lipopolysaccharide export system protein LptA